MKNEKQILNVIRKIKDELNKMKELLNGMSKGECYIMLYIIVLATIVGGLLLFILFLAISHLLSDYPIATISAILLLISPILLIECVIKKDKNKTEKEKDKNSI